MKRVIAVTSLLVIIGAGIAIFLLSASPTTLKLSPPLAEDLLFPAVSSGRLRFLSSSGLAEYDEDLSKTSPLGARIVLPKIVEQVWWGTEGALLRLGGYSPSDSFYPLLSPTPALSGPQELHWWYLNRRSPTPALLDLEPDIAKRPIKRVLAFSGETVTYESTDSGTFSYDLAARTSTSLGASASVSMLENYLLSRSSTEAFSLRDTTAGTETLLTLKDLYGDPWLLPGPKILYQVPVTGSTATEDSPRLMAYLRGLKGKASRLPGEVVLITGDPVGSGVALCKGGVAAATATHGIPSLH